MFIEFQKEFFSLAKIYLACRWLAMGRKVITANGIVPAIDLAYSLLGCVDYSKEMLLLVKECQTKYKMKTST